MKTISGPFQAHLDSGATTCCYCWKIVRRDSTILGFTEHDEKLTFAGVTFEAATSFQASQISQSLGMNVDNVDAAGALSSDAISESDLIAGRYDDAAVTLYYVNWMDVSQYTVILAGNIGEIKRSGIAFSAELRSLTNRLNQKTGRVFQRVCDAVFSDARCGFNKASVTYPAAVTAVASPRSFKASGLGAALSLQRGVVIWTAGPNNGLSYDIKAWVPGSPATIELWTPCAFTPIVGNTFNAVAGCLLTREYCRDVFNNLVNFQGFPDMPGNDALTRTPTRGGSNQFGGSVVRGSSQGFGS
jgi:uncharacterized phage protein (TIGR02218 family)